MKDQIKQEETGVGKSSNYLKRIFLLKITLRHWKDHKYLCKS